MAILMPVACQRPLGCGVIGQGSSAASATAGGFGMAFRRVSLASTRTAHAQPNTATPREQALMRQLAALKLASPTLAQRLELLQYARDATKAKESMADECAARLKRAERAEAQVRQTEVQLAAAAKEREELITGQKLLNQLLEQHQDELEELKAAAAKEQAELVTGQKLLNQLLEQQQDALDEAQAVVARQAQDLLQAAAVATECHRGQEAAREAARQADQRLQALQAMADCQRRYVFKSMADLTAAGKQQRRMEVESAAMQAQLQGLQNELELCRGELHGKKAELAQSLVEASKWRQRLAAVKAKEQHDATNSDDEAVCAGQAPEIAEFYKKTSALMRDLASRQHWSEPMKQALSGIHSAQYLASGGFGHVYRASVPGCAKPMAIKTMMVTAANPCLHQAAVTEVAVGHTAHCRNAAALMGVKTAVASRFTICREHGVMQRSIDYCHKCGCQSCQDTLEHLSTPGSFYVHALMDEATGSTLHNWVHTKQPAARAYWMALPQKFKVRAMARVTEGLKSLHALGVVHGDFKLPQILAMDADDIVNSLVVADFGINRTALPGATPTRPVRDPLHGLGTITHKAPEQLLRRLGPGSDVWALGQALLQMQDGLASLAVKHGEPKMQAAALNDWVAERFPDQKAEGRQAREAATGRYLVDVLVEERLLAREAAGSWPEGLRPIIADCLRVHPSQRADVDSIHCRLVALADRLAAEAAS